MSLSPRARMLVGFAIANGAIVALALLLFIYRSPPPPMIQGVLLAQAQQLAPFSLLDHHGDEFANGDLQGRWHVVSYGFTTCPDICPTTLSSLSTVQSILAERGLEDLQVLFYSVDHRRDTVGQLAAYLPFFNADFIGLTHIDDPANEHLPFEQSLGITARLVPADDPLAAAEDYQVLHGVNLLLLNPRGQLQAIFRPVETSPGVHVFDPGVLVEDYLAIRRYLATDNRRFLVSHQDS